MDHKPLSIQRPRMLQAVRVRIIDDDFKLIYNCSPQTSMAQLMELFGEKRGIKDISTMIFLHQNERLEPTQTVGNLGWRIGQTKDVIFQSTVFHKPVKDEKLIKTEGVKPEIKTDGMVSLRLLHGETELEFKLAIDAPFKKMMSKFADILHKDVQTLRFIHYGERLFAYGTPREAEMEDGDEIEVKYEMNGGANAAE